MRRLFLLFAIFLLVGCTEGQKTKPLPSAFAKPAEIDPEKLLNPILQPVPDEKKD